MMERQREDEPPMNTLFDRATPNPAGHRDVSPEQVLADGRATRIVDVREPHEFVDELGHIEGAESVPLATVGGAAARWSRAEPVVLICRSGRRSEQAAKLLTAAGFERVANMVGGMLAWNEARLPVVGAARRAPT